MRTLEGSPDQPHPINVQVRVELAADGEVWLEGIAAHWTRTHVWVTHISDQRLRPPGVWVVAGDVRRVATGEA